MAMISATGGQKQKPAAATPTESVNPSTNPDEPSNRPPADVADGAGGLAHVKRPGVKLAENQRRWYVAYVSPRSEKKVYQDLTEAGFEAYTPTHTEVHHWRNGRHKKIERVVITGVVFVKVFSNQLDSIRVFPNVYSFMMDPARRGNQQGLKTFAIIRDGEISLLKAMLGQAEYDVGFSSRFSVGDYVRIKGFDLTDELAQIVRLPGDKETYVGVRVGFLGCAYMHIPTAFIMKP